MYMGKKALMCENSLSQTTGMFVIQKIRSWLIVLCLLYVQSIESYYNEQNCIYMYVLIILCIFENMACVFLLDYAIL